jgi:hypothetical protein
MPGAEILKVALAILTPRERITSKQGPVTSFRAGTRRDHLAAEFADPLGISLPARESLIEPQRRPCRLNKLTPTHTRANFLSRTDN